jgi:hypothetical protein
MEVELFLLGNPRLCMDCVVHEYRRSRDVSLRD